MYKDEGGMFLGIKAERKSEAAGRSGLAALSDARESGRSKFMPNVSNEPANVYILSKNAPLAQSDRASVFGTEGWGFESLKVRHD